MTLSALLDDLYRRTGLPASPATASITRLTAYLNECQQELFSTPGSVVMLNDRTTFASVASTPEYSLPPIISRVNYIRDVTNRRVLQPMSELEYKHAYPDTTLTGLPYAYVDLGVSPISAQPADASELFFISTSAGDGNTKSVTVEGYRTGGYYRTATVAMNGVTGVSLGSTITDWIAVTKFEMVLAAGGLTTAAGTVTLREDSGVGTVLATIPIGQAFSKYRRLALVPTPSSIVTYTVDFERELTDMVNLSDEPILPARFHRLLGIGARMKEYERTDNTRYLQARNEYGLGVKDLIYWLSTQAAGSPNLRESMGEAPSRLGGYYPSLGW